MTRERLTVGIRELKQNPSDIIARAAGGASFSVLSHGRPVGVVIQREAVTRSRWVSSEEMSALSAAVAAREDTAGWVEELRQQRRQEGDEIVDPWELRTDDGMLS